MAEFSPDICVIGGGCRRHCGGYGGGRLWRAGGAGGAPLRAAAADNVAALTAAAGRATAMRREGQRRVLASAPPQPTSISSKCEHVAVAAALAPNESVARLTGLGIPVIEGEGAASRTGARCVAASALKFAPSVLVHRHRIDAGAAVHSRLEQGPSHQRQSLRSTIAATSSSSVPDRPALPWRRASAGDGGEVEPCSTPSNRSSPEDDECAPPSSSAGTRASSSAVASKFATRTRARQGAGDPRRHRGQRHRRGRAPAHRHRPQAGASAASRQKWPAFAVCNDAGVRVNKQLNLDRRIYAIGDVTGLSRSAYAAKSAPGWWSTRCSVRARS